MKDYMVILQEDGEQTARFFDTLREAQSLRMRAEDAEIYELREDEDGFNQYCQIFA